MNVGRCHAWCIAARLIVLLLPCHPVAPTGDCADSRQSNAICKERAHFHHTRAVILLRTATMPPGTMMRNPPKSPSRILADSTIQWLFTPHELASAPSILDGMSPSDFTAALTKGVTFITQVGILLKVPQITLSTASLFYHRFLMRASLQKTTTTPIPIPKLHNFQIAAISLFLATKVEESCRKLKEMILAFCRVAQKNPTLLVDEQSKDFWRWRDCVLHNEDVMLEVLCFDLTVESPHRMLFDMLKAYGIEHHKRARNAAWAFVSDAGNTQLCLMHNARTIAVAGIYAACKFSNIQLADDTKKRPWWETQHVRIEDITAIVEHMLENHEAAADRVNGIVKQTAGEAGEGSVYAGLATPAACWTDSQGDGWDSTRQREPAAGTPIGSERKLSNGSIAGVKRDRDSDGITNGEHGHHGVANGNTIENGRKKQRLSDERSADNVGRSAVALKSSDATRTSEPGAPDERADSKVDESARERKSRENVDDLKTEEERVRVEAGNKQAEEDVRNASMATAEAVQAAHDVVQASDSTISGLKPVSNQPKPVPPVVEPEEGSEDGEVEE